MSWRSAIIIFVAVPLIAGCASIQPKDNLKSFCAVHNITDATAVPDGITPVSFETVEEFEKYVLSLEQANQAPASRVEETFLDGNGTKSTYGITRTVRVTTRKNMTPLTYIELVADITIKNYGALGDQYISACHEWTWMGGITLGFDWEQAYAYHIITNATVCNVYGGGTLDTYLLVNGLIKIYSTHVSLSLRKEVQ